MDGNLINTTMSWALALQRLNITLKCNSSGLNCTLDKVESSSNETQMNSPYPCQYIDMANSEFIFMILYAMVGIIGLLGNTLVIYVVLRAPHMQTVTNMYLLNLAIADECLLIGIPFLISTMRLRTWPFGVAMCKVYMVSTSITQFASSIFLLVMSADRYVAICHHVSSPRFRTPTVSRCVSTLAWCASILIMLPIIIYGTAIEDQPNHYTCNIEWPESNEQSGTSFTLYSLTLGFAIPLCFIMSFYLLVIRKLRKVGKRTLQKAQSKRRSQHRKVTKLVLTVITVYVLCWLPYWVGQVILIFSSPEICYTQLHVTIFLFVSCLGYSNSAINPILYAYLSENFKKSFLKACVCAGGVREVNAQLKMENSVLPRKARSRSFLETTSITMRAETTTTATTAVCSGGRLNDIANSGNMVPRLRLAPTDAEKEDCLNVPDECDDGPVNNISLMDSNLNANASLISDDA